jgi:NADPH:quinone reductase-like Zn-dependent oxidoreductase
MTKTEPLDDSIESMGVTTAVSTMTAIVHDEYGIAPEDVLRLDEVDKPTIRADEVLVRDLMTIRDLIESGQISPVIDRTYPLGDVVPAIRYLTEGHARGKIVITIQSAAHS